jgi:hypothetical protein
MERYRTNAVYTKELKQSVRNIKFPITVGLYCFTIAVIGLFTLVAISAYGYPVYSAYTIKQDFITFYSVLFGLEFGLVIFVVPAITGGTISGERDHGTLDLLLATTLGPYRIIMGKLISVVSKLLIYVISSLPILALVFTMGGAGLVDLLRYMLLILLTSLYIGSFGVFMSVIFKKTSTAMAVTYVWIMFIALGTIFVTLMSTAVRPADNNALNPVFLLNPIITLFALLDAQIGLPELIGNYVKFENSTSFIMENWLMLSISVQFVITVINVLLATHFLNPFRGRAKKYVS